MTTHASPSLSERYQQATKYTPTSIKGLPGLDFSRQPSPFKTWHQARRVLLARDGEPSSAGPLDAGRLGRLLHHTYGVTLVREAPGMSLHYRAAPSAGGLYPTELYVAVQGVEGIPDGLFAYDAREHALVVCWEGHFGADLAHATFDHPALASARAVLIGTGVYGRSAWRYGDRAYRRVLLDAGHVFGNAAVAARAEGLALVPLPDFRDERLESLLLVDPAKEGVLLLGAILDATAARALPPVTPLRSPIAREAAEPAPGNWIATVHAAGRMDATTPATPAAVAATPGAGAIELAGPLPEPDPSEARQGIRQRRSTRVFTPAPVALDDVGHILAAAYPRHDTHARLTTDVLATWIVSAGVQGLHDGVHRYDAWTHTLTATRHGNPRDALHRCCLWQELGRDCAFAVIHTVDLPTAVAGYGERAYRTVHLDAGLIGQHLNLAAPRMGLGASGIGGFFDEHLLELLELPPQHAVVYVTTLGVPA